ncbi:hypothetical protein JY651_14585 [Pyxidicoccus parkwayensis]|uniref:Uncharacterized protein n=1 Tax=Pyxidicoccus parkwayensis TaxID=2813578 RepID=A0ABX7P6J2_9BACT|nr:hypothetical protein [Pyxidicoccus parkwaysis]QSQ26072.1 hypothetical protein JY651_14585 [Pyxidicoccus parkwaysis]
MSSFLFAVFIAFQHRIGPMSKRTVGGETPVAAVLAGDDGGTPHIVVSEGGSPETIEELRQALNRKQPTTRAELEADLQRVFPLIVPHEYVKSGMPIAHHPLPEKDLALTWVLLQPTTMRYLTPDEAARFDKEGFPWREKAIENLADAPEGMATHEKKSPDGRLLWMAMMHGDGLGSSRALLAPDWSHTLPEGYWLALPDRSCGMAISKSMKPSELAEVKTMVAAMYERATTPMSGRLYEPEELALPKEWFPRRSESEGGSP